MTGSMDILCVGLFGEAEVESRERLFRIKSTVEVKDDTGKPMSSHPDWDEHTYAESIRVFSQEDDYIYLPRIVSGEDLGLSQVIVGIQKFIVHPYLLWVNVPGVRNFWSFIASWRFPRYFKFYPWLLWV